MIVIGTTLSILGAFCVIGIAGFVLMSSAITSGEQDALALLWLTLVLGVPLQLVGLGAALIGNGIVRRSGDGVLKPSGMARFCKIVAFVVAGIGIGALVLGAIPNLAPPTRRYEQLITDGTMIAMIVSGLIVLSQLFAFLARVKREG